MNMPLHSLFRRCIRPGGVRFIAALLFAGLYFNASPAMAGLISCTNPVPGSYSFALPSGTYALPRNTPANTMVVPWTDWYTGGTAVWNCNGTSDPVAGQFHGAALWMQGLTDTGRTYTAGGVTYPVFATNLPGIGMVVGGSTYGPIGWANENTGRAYGYPVLTYATRMGGWSNVGYNNEYWTNTLFGFRLRVAFVTIDQPTAGTVVYAGQVGTTGMSTSVTGSTSFIYGPAQTAPIVFTGGPTFTLLSCVTPDILVDLGRHQSNEFTGINATTPMVDFDIKLNSCPAGMNFIKYRIDPATIVTMSAQSVVALDATSTATGVGIQLLDGAGAVHPLGAGTDRTFGGYNPTTGGSYTIPLKARYYQTSPGVTPGQANTTMMFTMTYL